MVAFLDLLACPACQGSLTGEWICHDCGARYAAPEAIPDLRLAADAKTDIVRQFYDRAPFPGYRACDTLESLRARADRSEFARLLDCAIAGDAKILEIGCGTGQMSLYLAHADRVVIGADLTRASLRLGAAAAKRFGVAGVQFVETDLHRPGLRPGAFDLVYAAGVLHHTPDPGLAFAKILRLARPGGLVVVGLYNRFARIPLRLRRFIAGLSGYRWIPFDPVLRDRASEPERRAAWLRDQYQHPQEHRHSVAQVRRWFRDHDAEYLRTYPSTLLGDKPTDLFAAEDDYWYPETVLAQIGWMRTLGPEGGLFMAIGRRGTA